MSGDAEDGSIRDNIDPDDIIEHDGREWVTSTTAAEALGCHRGTILNKANKGAITCKSHPKRKTWNIYLVVDLLDASVKSKHAGHRRELSVEKIVNQYKSGKFMDEIASAMGVAKSTIRNRLVESGVKIRTRGVHKINIRITKLRRKVIRYTRWAIGENVRQFGDRFGVSDNPICRVELGKGNIGHKWEVGGWGDIRSLARQNHIDPDDPKRLLHPSVIPDHLYRAKMECGGTWAGLSAAFGIHEGTLRYWATERHRPTPRYHKQLRDALQAHGLWEPPAIEDQTPDPEVELSDADKRQIRALSDSTSISDLAMMYGVSLSEIRQALKQ